jgi:hypothetical protein
MSNLISLLEELEALRHHPRQMLEAGEDFQSLCNLWPHLEIRFTASKAEFGRSLDPRRHALAPDISLLEDANPASGRITLLLLKTSPGAKLKAEDGARFCRGLRMALLLPGWKTGEQYRQDVRAFRRANNFSPGKDDPVDPRFYALFQAHAAMAAFLDMHPGGPEKAHALLPAMLSGMRETALGSVQETDPWVTERQHRLSDAGVTVRPHEESCNHVQDLLMASHARRQLIDNVRTEAEERAFHKELLQDLVEQRASLSARSLLRRLPMGKQSHLEDYLIELSQLEKLPGGEALVASELALFRLGLMNAENYPPSQYCSPRSHDALPILRTEARVIPEPIEPKGIKPRRPEPDGAKIFVFPVHPRRNGNEHSQPS